MAGPVCAKPVSVLPGADWVGKLGVTCEPDVVDWLSALSGADRGLSPTCTFSCGLGETDLSGRRLEFFWRLGAFAAVAGVVVGVLTGSGVGTVGII